MALPKPNTGVGPPDSRGRTDFRAWTLRQAQLLRQVNIPGLDGAALAEELEGMARGDERALESRLEILLIHLLQWRYQARRQTRSWRAPIENARTDIRSLMEDSPSLKSKVTALIARAYEKARRSAGVEMDLEERAWAALAPALCPWDFDLMVSNFWPEPTNGAAQ